MDETFAILWAEIQSHEVMLELSKQKIKQHTYITSIFVCFIITANLSEPLQEIYQMNRYIKVLRTKSDHYHGILTKLEE